jgi:hypothetical protein
LGLFIIFYKSSWTVVEDKCLCQMKDTETSS